MSTPVLIEGYAAVFGADDLSGDAVRAGAFARSLRRRGVVPMLLNHTAGAVVGRWTRLVEDGCGLFVRGLVETKTAQGLIESGLNGLSIGFRPRFYRPLNGAGRELIEIDLVEISLVAEPMQPAARFTAATALARAA